MYIYSYCTSLPLKFSRITVTVFSFLLLLLLLFYLSLSQSCTLLLGNPISVIQNKSAVSVFYFFVLQMTEEIRYYFFLWYVLLNMVSSSFSQAPEKCRIILYMHTCTEANTRLHTHMGTLTFTFPITFIPTLVQDCW